MKLNQNFIMQKKIILIILSSILCVNLFAQSDTVFLYDASQKTLLVENRYIKFLSDTSNALNFDEIRTKPFDTLFSEPTKLDITKLNTNIWFRFTVKNNSDKTEQWILAVPDFSYLEYFIIDESGNTETFKAGTKLPASEK